MADSEYTPLDSVAPLFTPFKLGRYQLAHRMVLAPLTRNRNSIPGQVPQPVMTTYYSQRASKGTFMLAEATGINSTASGYPGTPGIWNDEQVEAWKPIVKAVKGKGAIFWSQLWHAGRASHPALIDGQTPIGPSALAVPDKCWLGGTTMEPYPVPHELTKEDIKNVVQDFVKCAQNALAAGFDGVELHAANGYLIDQFTKSSTNKRTDEYGGSVENRCRFALEVLEAVLPVVGADRLGIRFSPFEDYLYAEDETPYTTFTYMVEQLNKYNLAYVHFIEPRMQNAVGTDGESGVSKKECLDPFRKVYQGTFIAAGGYKGESGAAAITSGHADLIAYGRWWIANPDLPKRFAIGAPLTKYDRSTFYYGGEKGYIDYPFLEEATN